MSSKNKSNLNTPEEYANLGSIYAQEKKWDLAIENYRQAILLKPNFSWYYYNLAQALNQQENWNDAIKNYYRAIELNQNFYWSYYNLGNALSKSKKWEEAINAYKNAIKIDTNFPWCYYNLGNALIELKKWDEAIYNYLYVTQLQPDIPGIYSKLGDAIEEKYQSNLDAGIKDYGKAIPEYEQYSLDDISLQFLQQNPNLFVQVADGLAQANKINGAIIFYKIALELNQDDLNISEKLQQVLDKRNQLEREILELRKEIELNQNSTSYYNLGIALTRQQKWEEAVIAYRQGIEINPDLSWWFYYNIWEAFARENKLTEILTFFEIFQKANPDSFWSYLNVGEALTRLERFDEAIPYYQTACYQQTQKLYPRLVSQPWNLEQVQGPNFIIIGVHKGGTTSLYSYLTQHPQIIPPIKKEMDFWSWKFNESINWYLAHFPGIPEGKKLLTGEASPSYFDHPNTARRIYQFFPKIKLLVLLRNPVDRAISQYYQWLRLNWENRSLEEAIESDLEKLTKAPEKVNYWMKELNYLARGVYIEFFKEWMSLFPREQFLILKSEDFYENPEASMEKVLTFLDLPEYQLLDYKNYNSGNYSQIDPLMRRSLSNYFRIHNERLEEYLGMKFNWE
ncbi:MAG: tetratricopeptide repeat protein [Okeania sp. SIO2F4]|uniref:tetratricopeptide repeat-containing sulfotransferase family protein n=1 Tax=Okeania sp. SIO2F4 TaxID=2607790 RepID=UPI0014294631|nr:tetratricopeptide repeat-containing sulfotransferase family protein [Okeania sp. SIO2F4]NES05439.1 tetratricopeptide repeat protein [Okeania sp. SIO2F4]